MQPKFKRTVAPKLRTFISFFLVLFLLILSTKGIMVLSGFMERTGMTPRTVAGLLSDSGTDLSPIHNRVNVVLLGIGGGNHDGADLTDTILILSFNTVNHTLGMISVPRDIWSNTLKDKVNSAYHYGEEKKKGGGLILSKAIISDMAGIPIQYGIMFDFTKFQQIIDLVGGITIDVPEAFTDAQYPIAGRENDPCGGDLTYACRYETLHFAAGVQTMDGVRALKYVRSRHASGAEGNDFARGRRQQQVILALKNKLTSVQVTTNPVKMIALYHAFDDASDTDLNLGQLLTVGKLFLRVGGDRITRISIEDLLYAPPESWYGAFVLVPKDSFDTIHKYVLSQLK